MVKIRTYNHKKAWFYARGKRYYLKSSYEYKYAAFLELLVKQKSIKDWEYETDTFWFDGIKRGINNYTPDFKIINNDDSIVFHEVKGYLDSQSKTKMKRMKKYHPNVNILMVGPTFFNKNKALLMTFDAALKRYGDT